MRERDRKGSAPDAIVGARRELDAGRGRIATPELLRALRDPVVVILVLAGIFDGLSGNPIHSILLFSAALAILWDSVAHARDVPAEPASTYVGKEPQAGASPAVELAPTRLLAPVLFIAAAVYAVLIGGFGRYSWAATLLVAFPGAIGIAVAWRGPLGRGVDAPKLEPAGALAWASVFVALSLWELTSLLLQPSFTTDSYAHPTLSVLSDPVLASHPGRSIALFVWLALGWFLLQR